jgi:hypothetical protein
VAVVLTLVQTKQIRINTHKRSNIKTQYKKHKTQYKQYKNTVQKKTKHSISNIKTQYKQHKTQYIQVKILPKNPHNCQNTPTYTHPHITKQVQTTTVQDTHQIK